VHVAGVAEIRYGPGQLAAARLLRYYFPTAALRATTSVDGSVVVSLGRKYQHVASRAAVQKAMTADGVVQRDTATPTPSASSSAPAGC
jgi:hypothetical protein